MKLFLIAFIMAFIPTPAIAGQIGGDTMGCPDNGYRIEQKAENVKVTIKYARTDFDIDYKFDGVFVEPRYGDITFTDPEGNDNYECRWAYFRVANSGNRLRIVEYWEGIKSITGTYRIR